MVVNEFLAILIHHIWYFYKLYVDTHDNNRFILFMIIISKTKNANYKWSKRTLINKTKTRTNYIRKQIILEILKLSKMNKHNQISTYDDKGFECRTDLSNLHLFNELEQ